MPVIKRKIDTLALKDNNKVSGDTGGILFSSLLLGKIIPLFLVMIRWGHIPRPLKEEDVEAIFSSKGDYMEGDKRDTAPTFEEFTFLQMAIAVKKKI